MRLEKFRKLLVEAGLDGFLVTQAENRRYLSGFTGSNGVLIISAERQLIATDFRYYEQVRQQCPEWELAEVGHDFPGHMLEILRGMSLAGRRVGFEADQVSVAQLFSWQRALQGHLALVNTEGLVATLRMQKDDQEIAALKKAIALADQAAAHVMTWLKPGQTELDVAWELESFMRSRGAQALAFDTIVASGPNSAKPHARPTGRQLQAGEPITLDFGCVIDGYCSDITRTVCLGKPADDRYLPIWQIVFDALEQAKQGIKAGLTGQAIDKIARDLIKAAGYGDNFGHSLGHGVGLFIHELPRFSFSYPHPIPAGAVVTVEPGIYLPAWGGVRLEDVVVVRENEAEVLTTAEKIAVLP
jgi:Xaa-Pro aminopeptidase